MKLRMAENSLFAILLRSRWWISLLVAVGFVAVSFALLPESVRMVGALGGAPFVIISVMAARRQWGLPSPAKAEALLKTAASMGWPDLAEALAAGWRREGYTVQRLQDGAADFLLERQGRTVVASARRWKAARVGTEPLRELLQAVDRHQASSGLFLALGEPSEAAATFARQNAITLMRGNALAQLLRDMPTTPAKAVRKT